MTRHTSGVLGSSRSDGGALRKSALVRQGKNIGFPSENLTFLLYFGISRLNSDPDNHCFIHRFHFCNKIKSSGKFKGRNLDLKIGVAFLTGVLMGESEMQHCLDRSAVVVARRAWILVHHGGH